MHKRTFAKGGKPDMTGLLLGYARVSKADDQTNTAQAHALRSAGCRRIFEETASGGRWDRPELHRMLDQLREGDTVVVWKLDRLSRSLMDALRIMERIAQSGASFRSLTETNIDTATPAGRMMMQIISTFAEFERAMIRERTSAGLATARAEGRIGGRRKKLDAVKRREIAESVLSGRKSGAEMARLYNISQPTVSRIVAQQRINDQEARAAGARNARSPQRFRRVTAEGGTSALPRR
jgi:DNA invertase Pin-like site-specific DNA recombinase